MSVKGKWVYAEPDRAKACEAAFQNLGPRVYIYEDWKQYPCNVSATRAITSAGLHQTVYARRKDGQRWEWFKFVIYKGA